MWCIILQINETKTKLHKNYSEKKTSAKFLPYPLSKLTNNNSIRLIININRKIVKYCVGNPLISKILKYR